MPKSIESQFQAIDDHSKQFIVDHADLLTILVEAFQKKFPVISYEYPGSEETPQKLNLPQFVFFNSKHFIADFLDTALDLFKQNKIENTEEFWRVFTFILIVRNDIALHQPQFNLLVQHHKPDLIQAIRSDKQLQQLLRNHEDPDNQSNAFKLKTPLLTIFKREKKTEKSNPHSKSMLEFCSIMEYNTHLTYHTHDYTKHPNRAALFQDEDSAEKLTTLRLFKKTELDSVENFTDAIHQLLNNQAHPAALAKAGLLSLTQQLSQETPSFSFETKIHMITTFFNIERLFPRPNFDNRKSKTINRLIMAMKKMGENAKTRGNFEFAMPLFAFILSTLPSTHHFPAATLDWFAQEKNKRHFIFAIKNHPAVFANPLKDKNTALDTIIDYHRFLLTVFQAQTKSREVVDGVLGSFKQPGAVI